MHLDFQREEDVCTKTCDRIDTVITIVIKTVTKLVREPQPLICFTSPPSPPYQLILVLYSPPPVSFSLHLFNDLSKHLAHSPLSSS